MAIKTIAQIRLDIDALIVTNGNEDITAALANVLFKDIVDSLENISGGALSFEKVLTKAEVNALDITPIQITPAELGLTAGKAISLVRQGELITVDPDGTPFVINLFKVIDMKNSLSELVMRAGENLIEAATKTQLNDKQAGALTLQDNLGYEITATDTITGGGANATITLKFFYNIITL